MVLGLVPDDRCKEIPELGGILDVGFFQGFWFRNGDKGLLGYVLGIRMGMEQGSGDRDGQRVKLIEEFPPGIRIPCFELCEEEFVLEHGGGRSCLVMLGGSCRASVFPFLWLFPGIPCSGFGGWGMAWLQ